MPTSKQQYIQHVSKVVRGAIKEVQRAHGVLIPDSIAKRVAAQLWGETIREAHGSDADWIRHVRGSIGLTQLQFANKIGTTQVTVARWESGVSKPAPYFRRCIENLAREIDS